MDFISQKNGLDHKGEKSGQYRRCSCKFGSSVLVTDQFVSSPFMHSRICGPYQQVDSCMARSFSATAWFFASDRSVVVECPFRVAVSSDPPVTL